MWAETLPSPEIWQAVGPTQREMVLLLLLFFPFSRFFIVKAFFFTSLLTRRNSEKCRSSSGIGDASYAWTAEAAQSKPYLKCRPGCALYLNLLPKLLTQHIFQMGVLQLYYFSAAPLSLPHMLNIEEICLISAISFFQIYPYKKSAFGFFFVLEFVLVSCK